MASKKEKDKMCPSCATEWSKKEIAKQSCETCGYPKTTSSDTFDEDDGIDDEYGSYLDDF